LDEAFSRPALQNGIAIAQAWLQEDQGRGADGLQEFGEPWTPQGRRGDAEPHLIPGGGGDLVGAGQDAKARKWHGLPPCRLGAIEGVERQSGATRLSIFCANHETDPGPTALEMPSISLPNRTRAYQQDAHPLFPLANPCFWPLSTVYLHVTDIAHFMAICSLGKRVVRVPYGQNNLEWQTELEKRFPQPLADFRVPFRSSERLIFTPFHKSEEREEPPPYCSPVKFAVLENNYAASRS
jgi:hypothetical protein